MSLSDTIIAAMRAAPSDFPWKMNTLRRACGYPSSSDLATAIQSLRYAGKVCFERLQLSPSMRLDLETDAATGGDATSPSASDVLPITEAVKAEAEARGVSRKAARSTGSVVRKKGEVVPLPDDAASMPGLSLGGQVQAAALQDNVLEAASIVRTRWNPVWRRVCLFAGMSGDRPIPAMIALLERALDAADVPEGEAAGFRRAADIGQNNRLPALQGRGA